jgi:hypothetical protein
MSQHALTFQVKVARRWAGFCVRSAFVKTHRAIRQRKKKSEKDQVKHVVV